MTSSIENSIEVTGDCLGSREKRLVSRAAQFMQMIEGAPKSVRCRARARIGKARRWYDLPEV